MPRKEPKRLDAFTQAYVEAMLWSTNDESNEQGGEPLDKNYGPGDIAPETMELIVRDCEDFQKRYADLLSDSGIADSRAGHDFWLSREGHGTGFFDEGTIDEEFQDPLQDAAKSYGPFELYVNDGVVYGPPPGDPPEWLKKRYPNRGRYLGEQARRGVTERRRPVVRHTNAMPFAEYERQVRALVVGPLPRGSEDYIRADFEAGRLPRSCANGLELLRQREGHTARPGVDEARRNPMLRAGPLNAIARRPPSRRS